jgi:CBS domain-containing protein
MLTPVGKVLFAVALFTACQDATPNQTPDGGTANQPDGGSAHGVARVEIAPVSALLTTVGQTRSLVARVFDGQGVEVEVVVTWSSSRPDDVGVDLHGQLVANRIGSAQIFAEAGGVHSPPALVVVAEPAAGALLVTDAQVVAVEPPVLAAGEVPGVGTQYDVRLTGVSPAPAPGTVLLASETAPVVGRVISTRSESGVLVVTLALAPLYEVLSAYHLDLSIELAPYAVTVLEDEPGLRAGSGQERLAPDTSPIQPFKALDCTGSAAASLFKKTIDLGIENKLKLTIKNDKDAGTPPTYSKVAWEARWRSPEPSRSGSTPPCRRPGRVWPRSRWICPSLAGSPCW